MDGDKLLTTPLLETMNSMGLKMKEQNQAEKRCKIYACSMTSNIIVKKLVIMEGCEISFTRLLHHTFTSVAVAFPMQNHLGF